MRHRANEVIEFLANSNDTLDSLVLRPLSHIASNWEIMWDETLERYAPEDGSFASTLNALIQELANTEPPAKYHDNEDRLARWTIEHLRWPIRKDNGRWVGADYEAILEQGGFHDVDHGELLKAASGRIWAAIDRGQRHFDDMEESHQAMLAAILSIILYHRADEAGLLSN